MFEKENNGYESDPMSCKAPAVLFFALSFLGFTGLPKCTLFHSWAALHVFTAKRVLLATSRTETHPNHRCSKPPRAIDFEADCDKPLKCVVAHKNLRADYASS
jgi:hypothetical protein